MTLFIPHARRAAPFALAVALTLLTAGWAAATDKPAIAFAPGSTSATLKGDIQGMDRDIYPITVKAGQTMRVSVSNKYKLVLFHIQLPGTTEAYLPGAGPDDDATQWQGVLPASGTYTIIVGAMRGKDTRYTLDVRVTN